MTVQHANDMNALRHTHALDSYYITIIPLRAHHDGLQDQFNCKLKIQETFNIAHYNFSVLIIMLQLK